MADWIGLDWTGLESKTERGASKQAQLTVADYSIDFGV